MERVLKSDKGIVVIYHADCPDGFSAAWAAREKMGDTADYFEFQNGDTLSCQVKDKKIFFLDVAPSREELVEVASSNTVVVIDHHKSNEQKIADLKDCLFDLRHSGAVLAWKYFHPDQEVPTFLLYIEDEDLWRWQLPDSKEIYAYSTTIEKDFRAWGKFISEMESEDSRGAIIGKGKVLLKYRQQLVEKIIRKTVMEVDFEGHRVMAINSSTLADEVAETLYLRHPPFAIVWFKMREGIKVSLRGNGEVDLSTLAEKYGGGGHKNSCGFIVESFDAIPWKIITS